MNRVSVTILLTVVCLIRNTSSSALRKPRLSLAEWTNYNYHEPQGPGTYAFGYDIEDAETNNIQFRNEERHPNGTVTGSYGYLQPDGNIHIVHYVADSNGYRATVEDRKHLSMLKPITLPDSPFLPEQTQSPESDLPNLKAFQTQIVPQKWIQPVDGNLLDQQQPYPHQQEQNYFLVPNNMKAYKPTGGYFLQRF